MRDKIKGILNARTAYDRLKSECQQRGASIVGDIVSKLLIDTAPNYRNIRDFSRAFLSRIDQLDRMALPWKVPEELLQIWYLHNLGDSFHNFRSSIYQHFKEAWTSQKPEVGQFRRLGCRAYYKLIPKALHPKKLDDRALTSQRRHAPRCSYLHTNSSA
jgi:hypothetical protein